MWAGGLLRGFNGPECSYCRYCTLQYLIWLGSSTVLPRGVPPPRHPSALPQLTGKDPLSATWLWMRGVGGVCAYVHMWRWQVKRHFAWHPECPLETKLPRRRSGSQYLLSSHQQRTMLKTHIGVCQLVRTLFTLHCSRLSIEHIPAGVSGQCRRWRTRSGLRAAVICLTSD